MGASLLLVCLHPHGRLQIVTVHQDIYQKAGQWTTDFTDKMDFHRSSLDLSVLIRLIREIRGPLTQSFNQHFGL
jgi:hypothetical protein